MSENRGDRRESKRSNKAKNKIDQKKFQNKEILKSDREDGEKWKGVGRGWLVRETVSGRRRQRHGGDERDLRWQGNCELFLCHMSAHVNTAQRVSDET